MKSRRGELAALVKFSEPLSVLDGSLSGFGWDSKDDIVIMTDSDMVAVLNRYSEGEFSSIDLTRWANLIECREDIGFTGGDNAVKRAIFRLANPELEVISIEAIVEEVKLSLTQ